MLLEGLRAVDKRLTMRLLPSALPRNLEWVLLKALLGLVGRQLLLLLLLVVVRMLLGCWALLPRSGLWSARGAPHCGVWGVELGMGRLWGSSGGPVPDAMVWCSPHARVALRVRACGVGGSTRLSDGRARCAEHCRP